jgi:uncharacterized phage protein gp47/JayE
MTVSTDYGVTDAGFLLKSLEVIKLEWEAAMRAVFGAGFNLEPETPEGQFVAIAVEREALLWEQLEAVYHATGNPSGAGGVALDNQGALTGAQRLISTQSAVVLTCTGTPGTVLAIGRAASVAVAGARFSTTAAATIAAVDAWAGTHAYALGALVTNGGNVYQCTDLGTSAGSGGPTGTDRETEVTDGGCKWRYLGEGTGAVDVDAVSDDYGPIAGPARSLTVIESPVSGWADVCNVLDAVPGRAPQTDADFRIRRAQLLRAQGLAAPDSIRAAVLLVEDVLSCTVYENTTDETDADSRPPHSVEVMVEGGADADIAAAVWASKPGGIETYGTTTTTTLDSKGTSRTVKFSRPIEVPIYITVRRTADVRTYPSDGDEQIRIAVVAWAATHWGIGDDVVSSALVGPAFAVDGVVDCPLPYIGTAASPSSTVTIAVNDRSRATFDSAHVVVEDL